MKDIEKHPWRICPFGEHWVKEHPRKVTISKKHPDGITIVDAHCRNKLVKDMRRVRLVGISPNEQIEKNYLTNEAIPKKLKKPSSIINWTFIRLETTKDCKGYFNEDCKPENYWGGLLPQQ